MNESGPAHMVRDATAADVAALKRCYRPADHAERIRTADGRARRYLVVETDGQVAGFGRLVLAETPDLPMVGLVPRIVNLNVRPDLRRRGLATALIREMERLARAAGHERVYIGVSPGNSPARSLYTRLGFAPMEPQPPRRPMESAEPGGVRHRRGRGAIWLVKALR